MSSWPGCSPWLCARCGQASLRLAASQLPCPPADTALKPPGRPAARPGWPSPASCASTSRSQATSPGAGASPSPPSSSKPKALSTSEAAPKGLRTARCATSPPRPSDDAAAVALLPWRGCAVPSPRPLPPPPPNKDLTNTRNRTQPPAAPATRAWSGTPWRKGRSAASRALRLVRPRAAGCGLGWS
jgi:hypothetical protein